MGDLAARRSSGCDPKAVGVTSQLKSCATVLIVVINVGRG